MKYLPPRRWADVTPGTVIMDHNGVARRVLSISPVYNDSRRDVFFEGLPPSQVQDYHFIAVVELDESDAITALLRAGFTVTPIKES